MSLAKYAHTGVFLGQSRRIGDRGSPPFYCVARVHAVLEVECQPRDIGKFFGSTLVRRSPSGVLKECIAVLTSGLVQMAK